jgi:regulator of sigma E protease
MINIVAIIFVFSVIVVIHELGHYLAARWMGVRVEKFSIGFPPSVYSRKIGDTTFSIGAIPLGGFVKMAGFIDESLDENTTGAPDEFNSKPVWRRVIIIVAGVIMNLILAVVIMSALNYVEGERIIPYTTVGWVGDGGIAQKIGLQKNDRIISINDVQVTTWNDIGSTFIDNLGNDITFKIERNGTVLQLNYPKEWFSEEKAELLDIAPIFPAKVGEVNVDMPAYNVGLKKGDEIISLGGAPVANWEEMTEIIRQYPDQEIPIQWKRDNQIYEGFIRPQAFEEKTPSEGIIKVGKIGIGQFYEHRDVGLLRAVSNGFSNTYNLITLNVRAIFWVLSGTKSAKEVIGGPIMIAKMAGDAAQAGWTYLWYLIAALNAMLAFFNILPIPALDGGHLFFLILEGIMGRPLSAKARVRVQQIGMALLLTFLVFILYVDLNRILF